jgi:hypothetical protein
MVNTVCGMEWFSRIKAGAEYIEIKKEEISQPMLKNAPLKKSNYGKVWDTYYKKGFGAASVLVVKSNGPSCLATLKSIIKKILPKPWTDKIRSVLGKDKELNNNG